MDIKKINGPILKNGEQNEAESSQKMKHKSFKTKKCSTFVAVSIMQIETTLRFHLTPVRNDNFNKRINSTR